MKLSARISVSAVTLLVLAGTVGCAKLKARDQLVKGVQAFKAGKFEEAVDHFQRSIELDPNYDVARLDLAAAYSSQVVPNLDSPENLKVAHQALDQFNIVLSKNQHDVIALRQIASIHRSIKMYDQARADELKVIQQAPNDDQAYYTIGVIDWTQAYKNATVILGAAGLTDDGLGNIKKSKDVCAKLQAQNTQLVDTAMQNLSKAISINPTYDDAMQYLNLAYRRKADLECGNDAARKADLATADDWVQKATGARKANEAAKEKKLGGGVSMK
ncbi:MAG: tetratricopeptide repeat protein [Acidobacteriaceae bacterium]